MIPEKRLKGTCARIWQRIERVIHGLRDAASLMVWSARTHIELYMEKPAD